MTNVTCIRMQNPARNPSPKDATLGDLQELMAQGGITAESLTAECLACIDAHDRHGAGLCALLRVSPDAEIDARQADAETAASRRGPLHGMPIVVKDNIDVAGHPTTSGNPALANAVALRDAAQTQRLRRAGAIIVGKSNLSEFSFEIRSRSSLGGDVLNPFNRRVTAGGSSGGTAAAVAAGFAVAGLGTDTGGSVRIPAAFNGLVGLRPTWGLIDMAGVAPLAPTTDTIGPLARSVADIARLLGVMTGTAGESWLPESPPARRRIEGARLGVLRQAFGSEFDIRRAMERVLAVAASAGAIVIDPVELPIDTLPVDRPHVVDWEFRPAFDAYLQTNFATGTAPKSLEAIYASGKYLADYREIFGKRLKVSSLDAPIYRDILGYHARLRSTLSALMSHFGLDALVYPTSAVTPASLENPKSGWAAELAACAGWPALTLPVGRSSSGIPIGLELLGRAHSEALLLTIAEDIEGLLGARMIPDLEAAPVSG